MDRSRPTLWLAILLAWSSTTGAADEIPPRYAEAVARLDAFIAREVAAKGLPALSVAIVDDQTILWSRGYGFSDAARTRLATAETIYRVGDVSQLFTNLASMQLVEQGKLDLDAPIQKYLPDFAPKNPFDAPATLREMMANRSGLVYEPPVGHSSDPTSPTLVATVASLNGTTLVDWPGTEDKYSRAAIATVGLAVERLGGLPFNRQLKERVFQPLGMTRSGFKLEPGLKADLAEARMWTYHGTEFPPSTFEPGNLPAVGLYSTATDLAKFLKVLFDGGKGVVKPETLGAMTTPQFVAAGEAEGTGLGFFVERFEGTRLISQAGICHGFTAELVALPEKKLGVVVITSKGTALGVTSRIANESLGLILASKEGKPLPTIEATTPVPLARARRWAGRYRSDSETISLIEWNGKLWLQADEGGTRLELRSVGDGFVVDDLVRPERHRIETDGESLRIEGQVFHRIASTIPPEPSAPYLGLIGEYGWEQDIFSILEVEGQLHALIDNVFFDPIKRVSDDVYVFPESVSSNPRESVVFHRDPTGRASEVVVGGVRYPRRNLDGENGKTFRIKPVRPVEVIRREIEGAKPPAESGALRAPDLVDLTTVVPGVKLDIRYASDNNFLGVPVYTAAKASMQRPAAEALARVQAKLAPKGYGLLIHDAYRPWRVTRLFWEATPEVNHTFVADPAKGSKHNRGCAVDLTLRDLATGQAVTMVGGYDEFSDRSYPLYPGGTSRQRWLRDLLREVMQSEGFTVNEAEWWHFDFQDWNQYPILDIPF